MNSNNETPHLWKRVSPRQWAAILFSLGLVFQFWLWIETNGFVDFNIGDDEGSYTFLAYEILGAIESTPIFDVRSPGWPITIAAILGVFGLENFWVVGLFHRLLLSLFPGLVFLTMVNIHKKNYALLAFLSVSTLVLPINRSGAFLATTEILYTFLQVLALFLISRWKALGASNSGWVSLALYVALLFRALVRLQSVPTYVGIVALFVILNLTQSKDLRRVLPNASIGLIPLVTVLLLIGLYNKAQTGAFGMPVLARAPTAFYWARSVDPTNFVVPESEEMAILREILPEVPENRMPLSYWPYHHVALYRAEVLNGKNRLDFQSDVITPATQQYILANLREYIQFVVRWAWHDVVPQPYSPRKDKLDYLATMPIPNNRLELLFGLRVTPEMWDFYENAISQSKFQAIPDQGRSSSNLFNLYMNVNRWPLHPGFSYEGLSGLIGMAGLLVFRRYKIGFALLIFYFGDLLPTAFVCGECVSHPRFQFPLESASLIAVLLFLVEFGNFLSRRFDSQATAE